MVASVLASFSSPDVSPRQSPNLHSRHRIQSRTPLARSIRDSLRGREGWYNRIQLFDVVRDGPEKDIVSMVETLLDTMQYIHFSVNHKALDWLEYVHHPRLLSSA